MDNWFTDLSTDSTLDPTGPPELALWTPESHLEIAVDEILSGTDEAVKASVHTTALLLACTGYAEESDRLMEAWRVHHGQSIVESDQRPLAHRAWAMLWQARGHQPAWAEAIVPLDLDEEEQRHLHYLRTKSEPEKNATLSTLDLVERFVGGDSKKTAVDKNARTKKLILTIELAATADDSAQAHQLLDEWACQATSRNRIPDLFPVAACRHLAFLLVSGTLGEFWETTPEWARRCRTEIGAALNAKVRTTVPNSKNTTNYSELSWPELLVRIIEARSIPETPVVELSSPATETELYACEQRLHITLPADYRQFLRNTNGLSEDITFPALLNTNSISRLNQDTDPRVLDFVQKPLPAKMFSQLIQISEYHDNGVILLAEIGSEYRFLFLNSDFGVNQYPNFRSLFEEHLYFLAHVI